MSEKRKIVVWIDEFAEDVERELADGAYTWEEYPDARLRAADRLVSVVKETLNRPTSYVDTRNIDKAIADYEGKEE